MAKEPMLCEEKLKKVKTLNHILIGTTIVSTVVAVYLAFSIHGEPSIVAGGRRIPVAEAVRMVKDFRGSAHAGSLGGTTSFIISKDSLDLLTPTKNISHIHAFVGLAPTGITLVFTGARVDSSVSPYRYVNEPFTDAGGVVYAMEHVIPCAWTSPNSWELCTLVQADGTPSAATIEANGSPDNSTGP